MAKMSDHWLVQYILGVIVNQALNCEFVEEANIEDMEDYPFVTFKWIDPGRETTGDWLGKHRQYTCTMQIDIRSNNKKQAMELAKQLYEVLHEVPYRRAFKQTYILPHAIGSAGNRTTLEGINYEYDYGFDCAFYVTGGMEFEEKDLKFDFREDTIESIKADGSVGDSNVSSAINVSKNNKEEI